MLLHHAGTDKGMQETFGSTCHGAGRARSRNNSRNALSYTQVLENLKTKGIAIRRVCSLALCSCIQLPVMGGDSGPVGVIDCSCAAVGPGEQVSGKRVKNQFCRAATGWPAPSS